MGDGEGEEGEHVCRKILQRRVRRDWESGRKGSVEWAETCLLYTCRASSKGRGKLFHSQRRRPAGNFADSCRQEDVHSLLRQLRRSVQLRKLRMTRTMDNAACYDQA